MPDIEFKVTNKHRQDVLDDIEVKVSKADDSAAAQVFKDKVDHKKGPKKGKKAAVAAGKSKAIVNFEETSGLTRKCACELDVGSDITKLRVHLSPLGVGQKLRLELKAWGASGWKSKTQVSTR